MMRLWWGPSSWLQTADFSWYPYKAEGLSQPSGVSLIRALIPILWVQPSWPTHLSMAPFSNTITLGVTISPWILGGHKHLDHSQYNEPPFTHNPYFSSYDYLCFIFTTSHSALSLFWNKWQILYHLIWKYSNVYLSKITTWKKIIAILLSHL